jgi:hypothetical protein
MDPWNLGRQERGVTVTEAWEGKGQYFNKTGAGTRDTATNSADDAVTISRTVAFIRIDRTYRDKRLGRRDEQIGDATPKFTRGTIIVRGRILDIAESGVGGTKRKRENEELFHGRTIKYAKFERVAMMNCPLGFCGFLGKYADFFRTGSIPRLFS